jgi:uncharacterized iron-regulated membrane protein
VLSPLQIVSLARDLFLVLAVAWLVWFIYHAGQNAEIKHDLAAIQKQLAVNAQKQAQWAQESKNAEDHRLVELQAVGAAIADQRRPIVVRVPAGSGTLPSGPATPASDPACTGGARAGVGKDIDVRAAINQFELKYEGYFAACRSLLNQWPQ